MIEISTLALLPTLGFAVTASGGEASREIDALLSKDWQMHKLAPNPPADEPAFVRRIHCR